ncbi:MAG: response regulator transcription factor [Bacteroidetes bacterium]|nr:response regulator transcription factor [Bacteroidota bacterium]
MISCIAIDDEPLALEIISAYVSKVSFLNMKGCFTDPFKAAETITNENIDLIFLDIEMPDLNGMQFLKSLKHPPMVIFITAYSQYAVESFNLDAVDYLLKPIEFERFYKAVNKANDYHRFIHNHQQTETNYIFVKSDYQIKKINIDEISYIEGLDDYIKIYCGEDFILTLMSLKSILSKLPSNKFIRVHRSYIVSIQHINSIQRNRIKINNQLIPISDSYSTDFFNLIENKQK